MKIHSSCDIEDFVETHLCKLCVILRSRLICTYRPRFSLKDPAEYMVAPVAYQVMFEPGIGQFFREFKSPECVLV